MDAQHRKNIKSESEMMQKLNQDRKQQNFEALRQWDQSRAFYLMTHRRVAQQIDQSLQSKITESDQFLNVVHQFLSDCEQQQKIYENQIVNNPQNKLRVNPVSKNIHMNTSKCLIRMYKTTQNFKPYKKIKTLLQQAIKNIQNIQSQSEREIMDIRTKIELAIVEIQKANDETSEKCDSIATAYKDKATNKLFQSQILDLFLLQQQFFQQAQKQTEVQKQYGQLTIEYLQLVEEYQKKKISLIKMALQKYMQALSQVRQKNDNILSLIDILKKNTQDSYIGILYSTEQILSQELIKDIYGVLHKKPTQKLNIQQIKNFLKNLTYQNFDNRNLILKQYRSYLKQQENQSSNADKELLLHNISLLISVDHYLHITINYEGQQVSIMTEKNIIPNLSINLLNPNTYELQRDGDMALKIGIKSNTNSHLIRLLTIIPQNQGSPNKRGYMDYILIIFMSEDQRQQFMEFVGKVVTK